MRTWLICFMFIALPACAADDNGTGGGGDAADVQADQAGGDGGGGGDTAGDTDRDPTADPAADTTADTAIDTATDPGGPDTPADAVAEDVPQLDLPTERVNTCTAPLEAAVAHASVPDGFCASIWADSLSQPRGIDVADNGDVLVVERGRAQVTALFDDDHDGLSSDAERATLAEHDGLNHGIVIHQGFLYASTDTAVYRWPYTAGDRTNRGESETVIDGIPGGGHSTRTMVFDTQGRFYVQVGSAGNVDDNADRAGIRRFELPETLSEPIDFSTGYYFASGMRNEVGVGLDLEGRIWGVENGTDDINRDDLGGDMHQNNPAEELNLFAEDGRFYGYPYCWSEFLLPGDAGSGPGTQWAHENFIADGTHTDVWCKNIDNVVPPRLAMQGHSAPLDVHFYRGGSFPTSWVNTAIVSFHGSWDRDVPTGYKVMHVLFEGGDPVGVEPLLEFDGSGDIGEGWPHRPVGIRTGAEGQVFVTSDASGVIIVIGNNGE